MGSRDVIGGRVIRVVIWMGLGWASEVSTLWVVRWKGCGGRIWRKSLAGDMGCLMGMSDARRLFPDVIVVNDSPLTGSDSEVGSTSD
jgi:hypothetical protein